MAPSYDQLEDDDMDLDEIDFSDLEEQYRQVQLDDGFDTFVVIDGLPVVPEDSKPKLVKFLLRKLTTVGKVREDAVFMPTDDKGMTEG